MASNNRSSSVVDQYITVPTSTANAAVVQVRGNIIVSRPNNKNNVDAVYAYIQAIRALGRDAVNTIDIADALSLSQGDVERAVSQLSDRGVHIQR